MSSDATRRTLRASRTGSPVEVVDVGAAVGAAVGGRDAPSEDLGRVVHWGRVDDAAPAPAPPRGSRRARVLAVAGTVVAVVVVGAVGGSVLVEEDDGARDVARSYVSAWQRLDCETVGDLASDPSTGNAQCRFVRFRANRFGEGSFGDRGFRRPPMRESTFDLVGVDETAREAEARFDVTWSGGDAEAWVDLRRDEQAQWRVTQFRVGQPF